MNNPDRFCMHPGYENQTFMTAICPWNKVLSARMAIILSSSYLLPYLIINKDYASFCRRNLRQLRCAKWRYWQTVGEYKQATNSLRCCYVDYWATKPIHSGLDEYRLLDCLLFYLLDFSFWQWPIKSVSYYANRKLSTITVSSKNEVMNVGWVYLAPTWKQPTELYPVYSTTWASKPFVMVFWYFS